MLIRQEAKASYQEGLYFQAYTYRLAAWAAVSEQAVRDILPSDRADWQYTSGEVEEEWQGVDGFFREEDEVQRFVEGFRELADS